MTGRKLFINICLGIICFSLFVLFFLKPKDGPMFERIDIKPSVVPTVVASPQVTPNASTTPEEKNKE